MATLEGTNKMSTAVKILNELEKFIDKAILPATIVLAILIIAHFFISLEQFEPYVTIVDYSVILIFVGDLTFKYTHTRDLRKFFGLYWLDMIAVFPFYLLTRTFLGLSSLLAGEETAQNVLHTITGLRESEVFKEARTVRALRELRLGQRIIRAIALRLRSAHEKMMSVHKKHEEKKK